MNKYIKNKELLLEIKISKNNNNKNPTVVLTNYFMLLIEKLANGKFKNSFKNNQDKEDAMQDAFIVIWNRWRSFDEDKYDNAFAYFTEIIKRSFVFSYKQRSSDNFINIEDLSEFNYSMDY